MNEERMHQTIDFLRTIPDEAFYYSSWFTHMDFEGEWEGKEIHDCGTQACAAGWMARYPLFQAQGFKISESGTYPEFRHLYGISAIADFLDIDRGMAKVIFINLGEYYFADLAFSERIIFARHVAQALEEYLNGEFDLEHAEYVLDRSGQPD